jgi:hypothetical protein
MLPASKLPFSRTALEHATTISEAAFDVAVP